MSIRHAYVLFLGMLIFPALPACSASKPIPREARTAADTVNYRDAQFLARAYPDANITLSEEGGGLYVTVNTGTTDETKILFSPWGNCPKAKPDEDKDAPLCASFAQPYPLGQGNRNPERGFDPGRVRNEAFLKALYGKSPVEVEKSLAAVDLFGEKLFFSTRQGASAALNRVITKLAAVVNTDPDATAYILPSGGTFAWRTIKNSPRLSVHSFAAAIDLNTQKGVYWLWYPSARALADAREHYPQAVVDAFESEGFIWGGKWYSFDFMHFEYRPEMVLHARAVYE